MNRDETFNERMNHKWRVTITEIDESGEEKVVHNELHSSVCMLAEDAESENRMSEIMINENLSGLASMIAASQKHRIAARIAIEMMDVERKKNFDMETLLMDMFQSAEGGIQ